MTRDQAIEIASHELARNGYTVSDYSVTVDQEDSNGEYWQLWFDAKGPYPVPGGRHGVRVNKTTREARFMPGE